MPTVMRIGPYRFFFYSGDGESRRISISSVMTRSQNSGLIRSAWLRVAASTGPSWVTSKSSSW